jgi:hypothetical protein
MSNDAVTILERCEHHLRAAKREGLDAGDEIAFRAVVAALDTVRALIWEAKEQRDLARQTVTEMLRIRHKPAHYKNLAAPATRQAALDEMGGEWRDTVETWPMAA